jgi:uncharacterized protein (DUF2147 family)
MNLYTNDKNILSNEKCRQNVITKKENKYTNGEILDPKKGKVYDCDLWREGGKLIVRGKIAFLGRNQTWEPNTTFKPETNEKPVPNKPRLK